MLMDLKFIGKRIREIRKLNNLTQSQLAEKINVSVPYISYIETGKKNISLKSFLNIVNELGITADELLYGNQICNYIEYELDIHILLSDCTKSQRQELYEIICFHKEMLKKR